ncbi:carbohydrate ABC transporter permease [Myceligenerans pegani]|uniref:Carbohydrate ABC transporter permease n=1 Tax=Myceligenerans pegani TaxID=2776917 RepID=A0ABR9MZR3_9MICO|nr:carbohydrate ABC transporter permease [Myceligenerans sp. TRM 65318]MBE1876580.1 carbohydrate ABC transporter permease [Myceligenerans sp. TRM 65318]MBE3018851.1 carbohydrate ABC transporter permease [Myceligenerans sp. TRM 65318]
MSAPAQARPARPRAARGRPYRRESVGVVERAVRWSLMAVAMALVLGPLVWQLSTALKGAGESTAGFPGNLVPVDPTLDNFVTAFTAIPLGRYLLNSAAISTLGVTTNLVLATLTGYALARVAFRGRALYVAILLATAALPFEVILVSTLLVTRGLGLQDTLLGVVLPQAVSIVSIFVMRQAFINVPDEIEEAAVVDGAGPLRVFWSVMLPSVRGSLAVVAVLGFLDTWDQFLWPLVILSDPANYPVNVGVQFLSGAFSADQRVISAAALIVVVPPLLVYFLMQRQVFTGLAEGALKG